MIKPQFMVKNTWFFGAFDNAFSDVKNGAGSLGTSQKVFKKLILERLFGGAGSLGPPKSLKNTWFLAVFLGLLVALVLGHLDGAGFSDT